MTESHEKSDVERPHKVVRRAYTVSSDRDMGAKSEGLKTLKLPRSKSLTTPLLGRISSFFKKDLKYPEGQVADTDSKKQEGKTSPNATFVRNLQFIKQDPAFSDFSFDLEAFQSSKYPVSGTLSSGFFSDPDDGRRDSSQVMKHENSQLDYTLKDCEYSFNSSKDISLKSLEQLKGSSNLNSWRSKSDIFPSNGNSRTSELLDLKVKEPLKKWRDRNKNKLFYFGILLLILFMLAAFIPPVVILARGTKSTFFSYFSKQSEGDQMSLLEELSNTFGINSGMRELNKTPPPPERNSLLSKGANNIDGLNSKYKNDPEVTSLMHRGKKYNGDLLYGVAYSPRAAMKPECGLQKRDVILDIAALSTVTKRVRNYGMQCNQSDYILSAIQELGLNMTLAMGVWISDNEQTNYRQLTAMREVLLKYPKDLFENIFIGNEVLFRQELTTQQLIDHVKLTKAFLREIGYDDIPVGTSEIGSLLNADLFAELDILGANVHPFFSGEPVGKASDWTVNFMKYQLEQMNKFNKQLLITEVGWPSKGGKYMSSVANYDNFQEFIETFVCKANENKYGWYYFEAFDEPWKKVFYEEENTWETEWGLFTVDRILKNDAILPRC